MNRLQCYSVNFKPFNPHVLNYLFAFNNERITNYLYCYNFSYYCDYEKFKGTIYLTVDVINYFHLSDVITSLDRHLYVSNNKEMLIDYNNLLELLNNIYYTVGLYEIWSTKHAINKFTEMVKLIDLILINWDDV